MESIIFVSVPFKGVFWHFKVDRRILLKLSVIDLLIKTIGVILKVFLESVVSSYIVVLVIDNLIGNIL